MLYAKVVLGLAVEGPFDYIVPEESQDLIDPGFRVEVDFCRRRKTGYVVGLSSKSRVRNLKKITRLLDDNPVLDARLLELTHQVSRYYCCSWGEAIETALPAALRKFRQVTGINKSGCAVRKAALQGGLLYEPALKSRLNHYLGEVSLTLKAGRSAIVLFPDINTCLDAASSFSLLPGASVGILLRKGKEELETWRKVRAGEVNVVVGVRSAIFAPLSNLGLIIIDEEDASVYKQDQVPHYHARRVAFMRSALEGAKVVLAGCAFSLESVYLARSGKIGYLRSPSVSPRPEIKLISPERRYRGKKQETGALSKYIQDAIGASLAGSEKVLLFLNRKGFATSASCSTCGAALKCPRCDINLVYHFKEGFLGCRYCSFRMPAPKMCPACNSGYIKFGGAGTEKIESELARLFPSARIVRLDKRAQGFNRDADIYVATSFITRQQSPDFDLTAVLNADNTLGRPELDAATRTFLILDQLAARTAKKMLIETGLHSHYCFRALLERDPERFYTEELRHRRELSFPPFRHLMLVKLRARSAERTEESALKLRELLKEPPQPKGVRVLQASRGEPPKLRGNYYWQVLISVKDPVKGCAFLKKRLKDFRHSGIIVTVDVDPL
ncbi:MAG: primosomal protein N' [Candidatus Omnitrophica bacterium]|nr:primosomal protein N' [Candidatus Omnitrophota bacterium]